jgi:hypothetical protein
MGIVAMEHFPYIFRVAQLPSALRYGKSVSRAVFTTDANGFIEDESAI